MNISPSPYPGQQVGQQVGPSELTRARAKEMAHRLVDTFASDKSKGLNPEEWRRMVNALSGSPGGSQSAPASALSNGSSSNGVAGASTANPGGNGTTSGAGTTNPGSSVSSGTSSPANPSSTPKDCREDTSASAAAGFAFAGR